MDIKRSLAAALIYATTLKGDRSPASVKGAKFAFPIRLALLERRQRPRVRTVRRRRLSRGAGRLRLAGCT